MRIEINNQRLHALLASEVQLVRSGHSSTEEGMCASETVAWLADEEPLEIPECACWLLAKIIQHVTDHASDEHRQEFIPVLPSLVGSKADLATTNERFRIITKFMQQKDGRSELSAGQWLKTVAREAGWQLPGRVVKGLANTNWSDDDEERLDFIFLGVALSAFIEKFDDLPAHDVVAMVGQALEVGPCGPSYQFMIEMAEAA